jgi:hypothetical protein
MADEVFCNRRNRIDIPNLIILYKEKIKHLETDLDDLRGRGDLLMAKMVSMQTDHDKELSFVKQAYAETIRLILEVWSR